MKEYRKTETVKRKREREREELKEKKLEKIRSDIETDTVCIINLDKRQLERRF
jgi:hypothetical protein